MPEPGVPSQIPRTKGGGGKSVRIRGSLTLTAVRLTGDRSIARVYYTVLGDEAQLERSRKALGRAAGFLRTQMAKTLKMRRVPELQFFPDSTIEQGNKIEAIFAKIHEEEAARPPVPEEDAENAVEEGS